MSDDPAYEFKTVKVLSPSRTGNRGRRAQDKLLTEMSADGWELVDASRLDAWSFGKHDDLTFRRVAGTGTPEPKTLNERLNTGTPEPETLNERLTRRWDRKRAERANRLGFRRGDRGDGADLGD